MTTDTDQLPHSYLHSIKRTLNSAADSKLFSVQLLSKLSPSRNVQHYGFMIQKARSTCCKHWKGRQVCHSLKSPSSQSVVSNTT